MWPCSGDWPAVAGTLCEQLKNLLLIINFRGITPSTYRPEWNSWPSRWIRTGTSWTGSCPPDSNRRTAWCRSARCTPSRRRPASASWACCGRIRRRICSVPPAVGSCWCWCDWGIWVGIDRGSLRWFYINKRQIAFIFDGGWTLEEEKQFDSIADWHVRMEQM